MQTDFAAALASTPAALHHFECLPDRRRHRFVQRVETARTPETRLRRIADAVEWLRMDGGAR